MHVLLPTIGSAGDVNPMIALGAALQGRGHRATIITNELFGDFVRSLGLGFIALGTIAEGEAAINDPRLWHPIKAFQCIAERALVPNLPRLYDILASHQGPGVVVAAPSTCIGARVAQEKLGMPLASVHLQPIVIRSLVDGGRLGRMPMGPGVPLVVKKSVYALADTFFIDRHLLPALNSFRARLGLQPVDKPFGDYLHSPQLVIGMFPPWFAPPRPDLAGEYASDWLRAAGCRRRAGNCRGGRRVSRSG